MLLAYRAALASPRVRASAIEVTEFPGLARTRGTSERCRRSPSTAIPTYEGNVPELVFVERLLASAELVRSRHGSKSQLTASGGVRAVSDMAHPSFGHGRMCELTAPERVRHFLLSIQTTEENPHEDDCSSLAILALALASAAAAVAAKPGAVPHRARRHSASWTTTATASGRTAASAAAAAASAATTATATAASTSAATATTSPPPPPPPADFTADVVTETDLGGYTFEAVGCRTAWVIRRQSALIVGTQLWSIELDVHWCYAFGLVRTIDQDEVRLLLRAGVVVRPLARHELRRRGWRSPPRSFVQAQFGVAR